MLLRITTDNAHDIRVYHWTVEEVGEEDEQYEVRFDAETETFAVDDEVEVTFSVDGVVESYEGTIESVDDEVVIVTGAIASG